MAAGGRRPPIWSATIRSSSRSSPEPQHRSSRSFRARALNIPGGPQDRMPRAGIPMPSSNRNQLATGRRPPRAWVGFVGFRRRGCRPGKDIVGRDMHERRAVSAQARASAVTDAPFTSPAKVRLGLGLVDRRIATALINRHPPADWRAALNTSRRTSEIRLLPPRTSSATPSPAERPLHLRPATWPRPVRKSTEASSRRRCPVDPGDAFVPQGDGQPGEYCRKDSRTSGPDSSAD